jgi:L-glyceraldehyde 3-phosphate reductase
VFSPLAQGILTNRYLDGIPADSRAGKPDTFLQPEKLTEDRMSKVRQLNKVALEHGLSLAQLAVNWTLRKPAVTSALIGASRSSQITEIVAGTRKLALSGEEIQEIDTILAS